MKSSVAEQGVVLAVYRGRPSAESAPELISDPKPPAVEAGAPPPIPLGDLESSARTLNRVVTDAGGDPIPEDLRPALVERWGIGAPASNLADPSALAVGAVNEDGMPPGARPVDVHGLRAAGRRRRARRSGLRRGSGATDWTATGSIRRAA